MKKTIFAIFSIAILLSGCNILHNQLPGLPMYVRVLNTGTTTTQGYIINEPYKHKTIQHFFPGLKPGDSTNYLVFHKLNEAEKVTVVLDSFAYSKRMSNCNDCTLTEAGDITIGINYTQKEQSGNKAPAISVYFYSGKKSNR